MFIIPGGILQLNGCGDFGTGNGAEDKIKKSVISDQLKKYCTIYF